MKTDKDIQELMNQETAVHGNAYNLLVMRLADYYISKSDGMERIVNELYKWDKGTRNAIINDVILKLEETGVKGFMKDFLKI